MASGLTEEGSIPAEKAQNFAFNSIAFSSMILSMRLWLNDHIA